MQLLLTDRLCCPRCGPTFGLILLAHAMADRRVEDGVLGCPNCRDAFPVEAGFADLRGPPRGDLTAGRAGETPGSWAGTASPDPEVQRVIALLGIPRGPGTVALIGASARYAASLVDAVEDLDAVVVDADTRRWPDRPGVSRIVARAGLPFFDRMLRGVVVDGGVGKAVLFEAARVTAPKSRVVVVDTVPDAAAILEEAGLSVLASDAETVVAARG